jgi:hypothetical protein
MKCKSLVHNWIFGEHCVIAKNAQFHPAFLAKTLRFTPLLRQKRVILLLL